MARSRSRRQLAIWMNGQPVGDWTLESDGTQALRYRDSWRQSELSRPLSLSLPFTRENTLRGPVVESFFDNLLPDSRLIRQRIQTRYRAASGRAFDLLAEIGRDCVGAVQLMPDDEAPDGFDRIEGELLSDGGVEAILRDVAVVDQGGEAGDFRISLAGAQEKTALLRHENRWYLPHGSTPTTHIFKLPMGRVGPFQADFATSCENEWLSAQIAAALGLNVATCELGFFGHQKALIVERFDRQMAGDQSHWLRLPQEDMCQAMGMPPSLKYEADGGPGMRDIMRLLVGSTNPAMDRDAFFRTQVVFWMLCAPDGHAKNFSLSLGRGGRFHLTPIYDVLSAYPVMGKGAGKWAPEKVKMAMAAIGSNRHYLWKRILPRHWLSTAHACGLGEERARSIIHDLVAMTDHALNDVSQSIPKDFPRQVHEPIMEGVRTASRLLRSGI
ncbi:MAG: type II toxin-antitoxin system HipA family toxin [Luteibacter sp.]